jgi:DNA polymerase
MNRQTAVLRELGLYPLWRRREMSVVQDAPVVFVRGETEICRVDKQSASTEPANSLVENTVQSESVEMSATQVVDACSLSTLPQNTDNENRANQFAPTGVVDTTVEIPSLEISPESRVNWATLRPQIETCQRCDLHAGCLQTVCGTGDLEADWLFIGDWSSEEDDVQGEPFMGAAGKLLDNMLRAIGLNRQQNVYLSNVLKCRPPEQHHSLSSEIEQCLPYLHQQIELIKPKKIIVLGNTAAHALLGGNVPLKTLRGQIHHYQAIPVIVTYHPAYLLRSPLEKAHVWADLCLAKDMDER